MVSAMPNPALEAFITLIAPELVLAEVFLRRTKDGFEIRHVADRASHGIGDRDVCFGPHKCDGAITPLGSYPPYKIGERGPRRTPTITGQNLTICRYQEA